MPRIQPTLHEAMRIILFDLPHKRASLDFVRKENRRLRLYCCKDGSFPNADQIRLRARKYPTLFKPLSAGIVELISQP
jgi:hypothetical protein